MIAFRSVLTIQECVFSENDCGGLYVCGENDYTITNNSFTNNERYAAVLRNVTFTPYPGNVASGNGIDGFVVSGSAEGMMSSNLPFVIMQSRGNVEVSDNCTLMLGPGTIVKFDDSTELLVNGTLDVNGEPDNPVVFTSLKDDT